MAVVPAPASLADGRVAVCEIVEITAIPHWELLGDTVAETAASVESVFARLTSDIHREDDSGALSIELLFVAAPVRNQTYQAQIRVFFVLRGVGSDSAELGARLLRMVQHVAAVLDEHEYSTRQLVSEADFSEFYELLATVSSDSVAAVARQERIVGGQAGIGLYYNDVIGASTGVNVSEIVNALSRRPNSAVSLQLIPTDYTAEERAGIARRRSVVDSLRAQILATPGGVVPASLSDAAVSYVDFINRQNDRAFYFNFLAFGTGSEAGALAVAVENALKAEDRVGSNALTIVDVSDAGLSLSDGFLTLPWTASDALVHDTREDAFWGSPGAPLDLVRLKYLAPLEVVRSVFKAPFDDGRVIGFKSRRSLSTRDRLHETVLSADSLRIGDVINVAMDGDESVQAGVPLGDLCRHMLVVGASGYGKTNFALGFLLRLWEEFGIPFLAIEPTKTEYRVLLDAIPDVSVFTPGRNDVSPFIINPFVPPPGVTVESYVPSLMTAFGAAFNMPDPLPSIFRAAVNDCYNRYGWKSTSTDDDHHAQRFGFFEFIRVFKERVGRLDYQGETKSNIESAGVVRLTSLIEQNSNIYDTVNTIPITELLKGPSIVELNAIGDKEQKSLLMALLLVALCTYTKSSCPMGANLQRVFLIDEAHVLLSHPSGDGEDARSKTVEALEDMIAEVRAYGTGIVIADQSPSNVGRNVVANTDVKVMFRLVERENRDIMSGATSMDASQESLLARLDVGECLLHTGRLTAPLHVKADDVRRVTPLPSSVSNERIRDEVRFWEARPELLIPYGQCRFNRCCRQGCDFPTRVDADFLASRMVGFYYDYIRDWAKLRAFLLTKAAPTAASCMKTPGVTASDRLQGCTTIKFVRKMLLERNMAVDDAHIAEVLADVRVMGQGAGIAADTPERKSHE